MTRRTVTVQARQEDGSLQPMTRTLYSARFGPIFDELEGIPLPWTPATAFALGDANATNFRVFNHFLETDRAQSTEQELQILEKYEGIPWVNTIVSDRGGHALYADIGTIPNVSNAKAKECDTAVGEGTFALVGLPVLDGSRSACNWDNDPDAAIPGIFGPSHLPHLLRADYVTNSNNSFWLSNPHEPLTGFARIIGDENTERSLRTRIGLVMTQEQVDKGGFTLQDMQNEVFGDRQYGGELARDEAVNMCRSFPAHGQRIPTHGGPGDPDGDFNALGVPFTGWGFAENEFGSSYVQVVTWGQKACPQAATILTYSLSSNPDSPFAGDQTELFSKKQWQTERFCSRDVTEHTQSKKVLRGS